MVPQEVEDGKISHIGAEADTHMRVECLGAWASLQTPEEVLDRIFQVFGSLLEKIQPS